MNRMIYRTAILVFICVAAMLWSGCSVKKVLMNSAAKALSGDASLVFSGEEDPELVAEALPFALKMYESILEQTPDHAPLLTATGKAFIMYSFAFVHTPAEQMTEDQLSEQGAARQRAKKLYLRGRNYLLHAMGVAHPGFEALINAGKTDSALSLTTIKDTSALYWTGMAWMGAITADKADIDLMVTMNSALAFMNRVQKLAPDFGEGSLDEFYLSYYGGLPASMGGSEQKARELFKKIIASSKGKKAGPYLSLATSISIRNQNLAEFRELLNMALLVDVSNRDANRLTNIIYQRKARWLLANTDRFFVGDEPAEADTNSGDSK